MTDIRASGNASAATGGQSILINNLGKPGVIMLAICGGLALGISIGTSVFLMARINSAETETRMLEYYVMELDGKAMKNGWIAPEESWSARKAKLKGEGK